MLSVERQRQRQLVIEAYKSCKSPWRSKLIVIDHNLSFALHAVNDGVVPSDIIAVSMTPPSQDAFDALPYGVTYHYGSVYFLPDDFVEAACVVWLDECTNGRHGGKWTTTLDKFRDVPVVFENKSLVLSDIAGPRCIAAFAKRHEGQARKGRHTQVVQYAGGGPRAFAFSTLRGFAVPPLLPYPRALPTRVQVVNALPPPPATPAAAAPARAPTTAPAAPAAPPPSLASAGSKAGSSPKPRPSGPPKRLPLEERLRNLTFPQPLWVAYTMKDASEHWFCGALTAYDFEADVACVFFEEDGELLDDYPLLQRLANGCAEFGDAAAASGSGAASGKLLKRARE